MLLFTTLLKESQHLLEKLELKKDTTKSTVDSKAAQCQSQELEDMFGDAVISETDEIHEVENPESKPVLKDKKVKRKKKNGNKPKPLSKKESGESKGSDQNKVSPLGEQSAPMAEEA